MKTYNNKLKRLIFIGILSAVGTVLMYFEFSVPLMPEFLKMDLAEIPSLFASFALGPIAGVTVSLCRNFIHLPVSYSAGVGEITNFLMSAAFCLTAGIIYKRKKSFGMNAAACLIGSVAMAAVSFPVNYYIAIPFYERVMSLNVLEMYNSDTVGLAVLSVNVPFTLIKGILSSAVMIALYPKLKKIYEKLI